MKLIITIDCHASNLDDEEVMQFMAEAAVPNLRKEWDRESSLSCSSDRGELASSPVYQTDRRRIYRRARQVFSRINIKRPKLIWIAATGF
jgi:hypothetical protein